MTERAYITVDRADSPRIIDVADVGGGGSNEVAVQDLHDTLNSNTLPAGDPDDSLDNMDDDALIASAGKEDLGGGVMVGITSTLQNSQIAFAGNYTPSQTGTATSADPAGLELVDLAADFVANGIARGYWIVNFSDHSVSEILHIQSPTMLHHAVLKSGTLNTWSIGDAYAIFEVVQKEVAGGNVVAIDDVGDPLTALFPRFATQIVRTSASSATLQEQSDIQHASFESHVAIRPSSPYSGTSYPVGTHRQPVNNIVDGMEIATERGFMALHFLEDITFTEDDIVEDFILSGESSDKTQITIDRDADVNNSEFQLATVLGVLDGGNVMRECRLLDVEYVDGHVTSCLLDGTITLSGAAPAEILDCWSGVPGLATPVIDFGGSGSSLGMRNYNGGITLRNKSGPEPVSIDMNSGQIIIDDTVTNGTIVLRGVARWTNKATYAGGANIVDQLISLDGIMERLNNSLYDGVTFENLQQILLAMAQGRIRETGTGTDVYEFYAQDNSTVLFTLTQTALERNRS